MAIMSAREESKKRGAAVAVMIDPKKHIRPVVSLRIYVLHIRMSVLCPTRVSVSIVSFARAIEGPDSSPIRRSRVYDLQINRSLSFRSIDLSPFLRHFLVVDKLCGVLYSLRYTIHNIHIICVPFIIRVLYILASVYPWWSERYCSGALADTRVTLTDHGASVPRLIIYVQSMNADTSTESFKWQCRTGASW